MWTQRWSRDPKVRSLDTLSGYSINLNEDKHLKRISHSGPPSSATTFPTTSTPSRGAAGPMRRRASSSTSGGSAATSTSIRPGEKERSLEYY